MKRFFPLQPYGRIAPEKDSIYQQIYDRVRRVPRGKVVTYGQVAGFVGRCTARLVGYAMAALPRGTDVPWQRVINYRGEISLRTQGDGSLRQRKLLQAEGIRFDAKGRVNLKKVRWNGSPKRLEARGTRN